MANNEIIEVRQIYDQYEREVAILGIDKISNLPELRTGAQRIT